MITKYKHVEMKQTGKLLFKHPEWEVRNHSRDDLLGTIEWYPIWRQYIFAPEYTTVYSRGCMRDISTFIDQLMAKPEGQQKEKQG